MAIMLRMFRTFLEGHRGTLLVSLLLALATTSLGLVIPWLTKMTVDQALVPGREDLLLPLAAAIVATGVLRFGFGFARRAVSGRMSLAVEADVRNRLFAHLQSLDMGFFGHWPTGQLISRSITDVRIVRMFLSYGLIFIVTHSLTLVAVTVILFAVEPRLAVFALLPMPLILVVARRFSSRIHPSLWAIQQRVAELTAVAEERITGIRVLKALAVEDHQQEVFGRASDNIYRQHLEAAGIRGRYISLLGLLPTLSLVIILFYGGRLVIADELTLGSLIAFNGYVMMLIWPLRMLGMLVSWTERARASGERIMELLDETAAVVEDPHARDLPQLEGRIRFESVSFSYDTQTVLDDVSLTVEPGETLALVGPTGCGKTTLALLVPRFYDPDAGRVLIDDVDVRTISLPALRRKVGLVDQDPFLFSLSVRDNIRFGDPDADDERVRAAAEAVAADEFISALPEGYDTVVGERGVTLSGGQRQRLALARALLINPPILVLDDATSSVDAETETRILETLRHLRGNHTVVVIAHRPSTVALADRVALMERGRVVKIGSPDEVPWDRILVEQADRPPDGRQSEAIQ